MKKLLILFLLILTSNSFGIPTNSELGKKLVDSYKYNCFKKVEETLTGDISYDYMRKRRCLCSAKNVVREVNESDYNSENFEEKNPEQLQDIKTLVILKCEAAISYDMNDEAYFNKDDTDFYFDVECNTGGPQNYNLCKLKKAKLVKNSN